MDKEGGRSEGGPVPSSYLLADPSLDGLNFPDKISPLPCDVVEFTWQPGGTHLAGEYAGENARLSQIHLPQSI